MSFLARTALRSLAPTIARASSSSAFPQQPQASQSAPSTSEAPSNPLLYESASSASAGSSLGSAQATKRMLPDASHIIPSTFTESDPDKWWRASELGQVNGNPGNNFSGRSIAVRPGGYVSAYNQLRRSMFAMSREIRRYERHEPPSELKSRLRMERHRRRFQEEIRKRVALVQLSQGRK